MSMIECIKPYLYKLRKNAHYLHLCVSSSESGLDLSIVRYPTIIQSTTSIQPRSRGATVHLPPNLFFALPPKSFPTFQIVVGYVSASIIDVLI